MELEHGRIGLGERPEKNHIWAAAEVFADHLDVSEPRQEFPGGDRELWYCPTATIWDAHRLRWLLDEYGIEQVYDLGAGDFRVSLWLDREGYDVTAYELNDDLVAGVRDRFDLGDVTLRKRDYFEEYGGLSGPESAVVCFGGTNELPWVPEEGLAVEGYGETGVTAWHAGDPVARW